jgi:hypothetical protein
VSTPTLFDDLKECNEHPWVLVAENIPTNFVEVLIGVILFL